MSEFALGDTRAAATAASTAPATDLYRAVWRWHFYAGLLVLPFLISLALTGALYLFRDEIDAIVHADLKQVARRADAAPVPPSVMVAAALAAYPGTAVKLITPATPTSSAEVTVATPAGRLAVYVDPGDGKVLGSLPDRGTVMWTVRYLHSLRYFGPVVRASIEIAGGWAILLVATGFYLWWPRGRSGGVVTVRGAPAKRIFWRDLHAVTGLFVGGIIVFLAITGMPWSGVWGAKVNEWANGSNFGYPAGVRVAVPMSDEHLAHSAPTTWSLEQAKTPESAPGATGARPIGLDRAAAIVSELGLHRGYTITIPSKPTGVYSASVYPDDIDRQRVVHLDQYSGKPLIDMSYRDYGPFGRWLEWGINVHMGQQYGLANQLALLAACLAIVMLAVSAAVMWWKRRPAGKLGVPPAPADPRIMRGLIGLLAIGGVLFPLVGLSLLVMLALDWMFGRRALAA